MSEEKKSPSIWEFKLPKMGESITEGTIINWLVNEGDEVEKDQIILEVATDKVDSEVPSSVRGTIKNILAEADSVVKVGEVIAKIEVSEDQSDQTKEVSAKKSESESKKPKPAKKKAALTSSSKPTSDTKTYTINKNQNTYISPLIQNIAIDYHISYEELARIPATGHDGRLRKSDVFKYIEEGRPAQFAQPQTE
ncbi:MAG: biotin/lipoyl-containing protein, partial [Psychroflexus sp.]